MILLKLNWTSCSRSKRCINNWSSELWHAKSSNFTFCEEKKNIFERENIKRIKNKEGKNGRDVNHKEKPKESLLSLSFFFVDTHSPCELEQLVIHKIKGRAAARSMLEISSDHPVGKTNQLEFSHQTAWLFYLYAITDSKVVGLLTLLKGW